MATRILIVSGSSREGSTSKLLCEIAAEAAREAGAELRWTDLRETRLPLFVSGDAELAARAEVHEVRALARWAQGFLLGTPEYHGSLSGSLKNWFDWLYEELAGKTAAVLASTGGGGGDLSVLAVKSSFNTCHGFTLPFHAAARRSDFAEGRLLDEKVRERVQRLAYDLVRYAPLIRSAFESAKAEGKSLASGFSGYHLDD